MGVYLARPEDGAAWITGASAGIGRELALKLANEGYTVYASARSAEALDKLATEFSGKGRIISLPLDVTDEKANREAVERIVSESGRLILAVFNAGVFLPIRGSELELSTFEKSFGLNFFGVLNGLLPTIEVMKEAGIGQIAIVSSSAGYGGLPKSAAYGSTKAALINLAESLKFDLDPLNIRIQVVTPGFVKTPATDKNDFHMPFLMPADEAAEVFSRGLKADVFDISFPKRFTYILKFLNLLPYRMYFWLVSRQTGIGRK
ncbi:MAG: SDR family NAD(P)-dependent oxidoreductase [Rhizobiaceae bacterium]